MTALSYLLMCLLYFICVGLDVAMFFIQIRLILQWRNTSWLVPFDNAGKSLVDNITKKVPQILRIQKPLSKKGKLLITLIVLAISRVILGSILG